MSSKVDGGASTPLIPPLRLDVSLVDVFHTHTYAEMSTTRQGKYHAERERERERRENKKRNAHTHHTHTTNNVHATLYPKYYTNVYPTLLFAVCFRIAMPSIPTQLNSTQPPNIHPPTAPSPLFRPPPQHPPRPPLKSPHHLLHHPPRHPSHRHPQRRIREPVPNRQGYLGPSVVPSGGGGYRPPGD